MRTTLTLAALMLTACVQQPAYPDSPKYRACKYDATRATTGGQFYGARGTIDGAYAEAAAYRNILNACMAQ